MTLRASPFSFLPFFLYYIPICQSFSGSLMTMRGTQFWGSSHPWRCRLKALWRIGLRTSFPHPHQWEAHSTCARTEHNSPWSSGTAWFPESLSATAQVSTNNSLSMSNSVSGFFLLKVSKLNRIELFILIMKLIIRIIINNLIIFLWLFDPVFTWFPDAKRKGNQFPLVFQMPLTVLRRVRKVLLC